MKLSVGVSFNPSPTLFRDFEISPYKLFNPKFHFMTNTATATYTNLHELVVGQDFRIVNSKVVQSTKDNSTTQVFSLQFEGEYKTLGEQTAYRRLGQGTRADGSTFEVEALNTLDNTKVVVSKRNEDGSIFFSVKGLSKDFAVEKEEAQARAKALFG